MQTRPGDAVDQRRLLEELERGAADRLRATRPAPLTSRRAPAGTAPASARTTTSGSSTRHERVEVAVPSGGQEGVDHLALALDIRVGHRALALDAPAGPAGELAGRLG